MTSPLQWCIKEGAWVMHWYSSHLLKDRWISHLFSLNTVFVCVRRTYRAQHTYTSVSYVREALWLGVSVLFTPTSARKSSHVFCTQPKMWGVQQSWKLKWITEIYTSYCHVKSPVLVIPVWDEKMVPTLDLWNAYRIIYTNLQTHDGQAESLCLKASEWLALKTDTVVPLQCETWTWTFFYQRW